MKFATEVIWVPFGRAEVSMGARDALFRKLSHGHGLRGACFHKSFKSLDFTIVLFTF